MKCPLCGKESRNDIYTKIDDSIVYFCSTSCAFEFMVKSFNEGKIIGIRIPEE